MARDQYLQHFGKIGTGDIMLLAEEIEKEKVPKGEGTPLGVNAAANLTAGGEEGVEKPGGSVDCAVPVNNGNSVDSEGDVKMEER